jgi:molybdenum cofactor biosynthesis enzyme MoaA
MKVQDFEIFKQNSYTAFENNGKVYLINREPYLDIVLTDYCNANCKFCIADLIHDKLKLDFEKFKKKVEFAVTNMRVKEVLLLGGEPTMSKLLIPAIEYLKTLPLNKIVMTTNGLRLAHDKEYREQVLKAGLTHLNISYMCSDIVAQRELNAAEQPLTLDDLRTIYRTAHRYNVDVRINNNIYKGNNDSVLKIIEFYESVKHFCDSIKFSPLLKTDSFSVVDVKTQWVNDNILSDEEYDELFEKLEISYFNRKNIDSITNDETFGFVKNSMIPLATPIILNWNQHGQMMNKVVKEHKINNIKLLPNNELSLSWNRDLSEYFIKTS